MNRNLLPLAKVRAIFRTKLGGEFLFGKIEGRLNFFLFFIDDKIIEKSNPFLFGEFVVFSIFPFMVIMIVFRLNILIVINCY